MKNKFEKGFTLIEVIIYTAIIGLVLTSIISLTLSFTFVKNKSYAIQEVNNSLRLGLDLMSQKIKSAQDVNLVDSIFNSDPGTLSLAMADADKNPTIINLNQDDGVLQIKEGAFDPVYITGNKIKITNLTFSSATASSSKESIVIMLTASYQGDSKDFFYTQSGQTAVNVRK